MVDKVIEIEKKFYRVPKGTRLGDHLSSADGDGTTFFIDTDDKFKMVIWKWSRSGSATNGKV